MRRMYVQKQSGFTLIEVILAVAIIAIMFPFFMGIFTTSRANVKDGEFELVALRHGEDVMEEARYLIKNGVVNNISELREEIEENSEPIEDSSFVRTVEVKSEADASEDEHIPPHTVKVTVTLEWPRLRSESSLELSSFIFTQGW